MTDAKEAKEAKEAKKKAKAPLEITATPTQILEAIPPITTIVEEKWPIGFEGGYWVGKLLGKLLAEQKAILSGRDSLLREYCELNEDGTMAELPNGNAKFAPGQYQRFAKRRDEEMAKARLLEGVRPILTSQFSKETREKLKTEQLSGAALGILIGTPFLLEDSPLFTG